jgi:hypothetical protein
MSRKYPKKVRNEHKRKLKAADAFVRAWTESGLSSTLIHDYNCFLNCGEAESYSGLFRAYGAPDTAESILADHSEDCDTPHYHKAQGVWTFTVEAHFASGESDEWTVVADGSGEQAEDRAKQWVRDALRAQGAAVMYVLASESGEGTPGSLPLYDWIDIRKAK